MATPLRVERSWVERARSFADREIAPRAEAMDRDDALPTELLHSLADSQLLGISVPAEFGGGSAGSATLAAVLEEISRASAAVAVLLAVHLSVCAAPITEWGTPEQKERCLRPLAAGHWIGAFGLTEPSAGSDAKGLTTRYSSSAEGFTITGSKTFITNGGLADLLLLFATRDPQLESRGITAFLLPKGTPGFSVTSRFNKLGLRGSETTELSLIDVRLPPAARLGPEGSGLHVALSALTGGRIGIAACALGVAQASFESLRHSASRSPSDLSRAQVARAYTDVAAARALLRDTAERRDRGERVEQEASAAKLFCSQVAVRVAAEALDRAGRDGEDARTAGRLLRDARVFPIVEGTTEIQELILGRSLIGR
ncbi:MAG: acyl-CoA dehydrogenase family protein [Thermoplasmata archaeon]|nr:acyl-CoA dehydrogenase family protein [Thermoplasmata archaeon]MCI4338638.1 acyl-CoA dehydrogenase family protein [Thermoplasmata archaeon]MCI4341803.1 acyl-CoA dehydrogenase family protein [Thermoplasmata archaeon]